MFGLYAAYASAASLLLTFGEVKKAVVETRAQWNYLSEEALVRHRISLRRNWNSSFAFSKSQYAAAVPLSTDVFFLSPTITA